MTRGKSIALGCGMVLLAALLVVGVGVFMVARAVSKRVEETKKLIAAMDSASVPAPQERCVVAQRFGFADGTSAMFGHGFFTRAHDQSAVAVTALHFLDLGGPGLILVEWLDRDLMPFAASERTFAGPGRQPDALFENVSTDYLLLSPDRPITEVAFLELDDRATGVEVHEPLWFAGYSEWDGETRWVRAAVKRVSPLVIEAKLKEDIELRGTSGSPVLSGRTGKVVAIMSGYRSVGAYRTVLLTPIGAVREALKKPAEKKRLAEINWSLHRAQEKAGP